MEHYLKNLALALMATILPAVNLFPAELPDGFVDEPVLTGLNVPVSAAEFPDGRIIVLEQYVGVAQIGMRDADSAVMRATPALHIPDVNTEGGNERGLLSVAVDPQYPARPFVYLYYTSQGHTNRLARYTFPPGAEVIDSATRVDIISDIPDNAWNHNGGSVRFGADSMLYLSIGDDANSCAAQDITDLRGMILRLDVRGIPLNAKESPDKSALAPADNPFVSTDNENAALVYHYGLRNPFRFDIDPVSGAMLIADVGLVDFEEIDYSPGGAGGYNFGWPFHEGPAPRAEPDCEVPEGAVFVEPVAFYDRTGFQASVISLCVYRANDDAPYRWPAEYNGDYFYTDYFQGFIRRLKRDTANVWSAPAQVSGQKSALDWAVGSRPEIETLEYVDNSAQHTTIQHVLCACAGEKMRMC